MAHRELDNLVQIGQLKAEPPAESELAGLIRSGLVRLTDAELEGLSLENRFDLASNATHSQPYGGSATGPSRAISFSNV